jgi:molecular chaperone DnaK (HSP70)
MSNYNDISDVHMLKHWPTSTTESPVTETKTPSQIAYAAENSKSNLLQNAWGYQITPRMSRYAWMKLLLDQNALPSPYDDPHLKDEIQNGVFALPKSAQDVTSDYVRELYTYTMKSLLEILFKGEEEVLDITPIKFWFTMPAIWSDEAQAKTLAAARAAGFGKREGDEICMIKEPEAAALATLSETTVDWDTSAKVCIFLNFSLQ